MNYPAPTIIVLVGITGDLSKRKLLPALENLQRNGMLPEHFELVGITRQHTDQGYVQMDLDKKEDYARLALHLQGIERKWGVSAQRLFYLAVAQSAASSIIRYLGDSGLAAVPNTKLLLEKPFALDIGNAFSEDAIYRVDHYLAKRSIMSMAQLDLKDVHRIVIEASESIGIEGRGNFYEQSGALKDIIEGHLLEVAAHVVAPHDRLAVLRAMEGVTTACRGQYIGYRDAVNNPESIVETFASVEIPVHTDLYNGTVLLKTGKAMSAKRTSLSLQYADGASHVFSLHDTENAYETVFMEAMQGNKSLFVSQEEVAEMHRIVAPLSKTWRDSREGLVFYEPGTDPK